MADLIIPGYNKAQCKAFTRILSRSEIGRMPEYNKDVKYVGPEKKPGLSRWIRRHGPGGADYNFPAFCHDFYYGEAAKVDDPELHDELREEADLMFLLLMLVVAEHKDYSTGTRWLRRTADRFGALLYYDAVRDWGAPCATKDG